MKEGTEGLDVCGEALCFAFLGHRCETAGLAFVRRGDQRESSEPAMTAAPTPDPSSAWYVLIDLPDVLVSSHARFESARGGNAPALLAKDVDKALLEPLRELGVFLQIRALV